MRSVKILALAAAAVAGSVAISAGASGALAPSPEGTVIVRSADAITWHARHVKPGPPRQEIDLRGNLRLSRRISLARTHLRVRTLLAEGSSRGELVRTSSGSDAAPLTLPLERLHLKRNRAVYDAGSKAPAVRIVFYRSVALTGDPSRHIAVRLQIAGGRFRQPQRCVDGGASTTLATHFILLRRTKPVADVVIPTRWSCRTPGF